MTTQPNQFATFANLDDGVMSLVTKISKGYAVSLWDTDAQLSVGVVKIYPFSMLSQAITYAKRIANV